MSNWSLDHSLFKSINQHIFSFIYLFFSWCLALKRLMCWACSRSEAVEMENKVPAGLFSIMSVKHSKYHLHPLHYCSKWGISTLYVYSTLNVLQSLLWSVAHSHTVCYMYTLNINISDAGWQWCRNYLYFFPLNLTFLETQKTVVAIRKDCYPFYVSKPNTKLRPATISLAFITSGKSFEESQAGRLQPEYVVRAFCHL